MVFCQHHQHINTISCLYDDLDHNCVGHFVGPKGSLKSFTNNRYSKKGYLNHETAVKVVNALVSSRLDYCNPLLYNTKKAYTVRLQRVQNAFCRTVCKLNKYCHVTPFLHKLHWLPIYYRILFKYNLLTYKAIHFSQPSYLSSLITN